MNSAVVAVASALAISQGAKLVLITANGVAITDYRSMEECRAARAALIEQWHAEQESAVPPGYKIVVPAPLHVICIPD
jgi:hypothetical protein